MSYAIIQPFLRDNQCLFNPTLTMKNTKYSMMCNTCTFSGNLIVQLFLEKHNFIVQSYWLIKSGVPSLNVEVSILNANIPANIFILDHVEKFY
jgi:hypothetical protein